MSIQPAPVSAVEPPSTGPDSGIHPGPVGPAASASAGNDPAPRTSPLAEALAELGLMVFALTAWLSPAANRWALGLCGFALLLAPDARARALRQPPFLAALLFLLFVALEATHGARLLPGSAASQWTGIDEWIILPGFLIIGWWLKADLRRINRFLGFALAGLMLGLLHSADWVEVLRFHAERQTGFDLPAQTSGLIAASALLGLLLFAPRILGAGATRRHTWVRRLTWLLGLYLCAYLVVVSQSRGTWLAAAIVFVWAFGSRAVRAAGDGDVPDRRLPRVLGAALIVGLLAAGMLRNADSFLKRTAPDLDTATAILSGKTPDPAHTSFSYRYSVQKFGWGKFLERPLFGWGAGSSRPLIEASALPELYNPESGRWLGRMHNAYLDIGVRFGLAGLVFLAATVGYAVRSLNEARRRAELPDDYWRFFVGALLLLLLWGVTATFVSPPWQAYWMVLMGVASSFGLAAPAPAASRR